MDKFVMDIRLKQWIPILEAQASSGLDKQTFCKQHGISRGLFFKWQRILREKMAEGFDPASISLPAITDNGTGDIKNNEPMFYELSPTAPCSLAENSKPVENLASDAGFLAPKNASEVTISYGGFSINLSGAVEEASLKSILRAVKHA